MRLTDRRRFYYADERTKEGDAVYNNIDGPAHAKFYAELVDNASQGEWLQTFVKGIGYTRF